MTDLLGSCPQRGGDDSQSLSSAQEAIEAAEARLGLRFPPSYRQFLLAGRPDDAASADVLRAEAGGEGSADVVWFTLALRRYGLPPEMIVIEDRRQGTVHCLDTSRAGPDDEAPVVEWAVGLPLAQQDSRPLALSFADLLLLRRQRLLYRQRAAS